MADAAYHGLERFHIYRTYFTAIAVFNVDYRTMSMHGVAAALGLRRSRYHTR